MKSLIWIRDLGIQVYLGHTDLERQQLQTVRLDIELDFQTPILAQHTDRLADTICYQTLEDQLRAEIENRTFHLLEHLGFICYEVLQRNLPQTVSVKLSVTKFLGEPQGSRTFTLLQEETQ